MAYIAAVEESVSAPPKTKSKSMADIDPTGKLKAWQEQQGIDEDGFDKILNIYLARFEEAISPEGMLKGTDSDALASIAEEIRGVGDPAVASAIINAIDLSLIHI